MTVATRKRRTDRNQLIYQIWNTYTGESYIGITVSTGNTKKEKEKALKVRWQKHVRRALTEGRDWTFCQAIREHGPEAFEREVIEVVRGKAAAHVRELEIIREIEAELNTAN